mgnify:CR=1 FL=1
MTTTLIAIGFGLLFFLCILASIGLHEVGHMLPAKRFGVRVPKYFVGFGPTLWSTTRGETEYGLKWIPLGGYVRLLGMYPPGKGGRKVTRLGEFADAARAAEWSEITPTDVENERLLYQKKTWQKLVIMAGGPMMNVLIAFFVFWAVIGIHGYSQAQPTVARVQECVIRENATSTACTPDAQPSPARLAGLAAGDEIVSFNGVAIASYDQLVDLIRANLDGPASVVVRRGGATLTLPTVNTVIDGVPDKLDPSRRIPAGWFGVSPTVALVHGGPDEVVRQLWTLSAQSMVALAQFPVKVWSVVADMVTGKPRDIYGPMSIVGATVAAGEIAANDQLSWGDRAAILGSLLGSLNLFLALFNFLPLPPLDGGHIAGALWEGARRRWAALRGRPDPGPVDTARLLPVAYTVAAFLIVSGVALIIADLFSPIRLF